MAKKAVVELPIDRVIRKLRETLLEIDNLYIAEYEALKTNGLTSDLEYEIQDTLEAAYSWKDEHDHSLRY